MMKVSLRFVQSFGPLMRLAFETIPARATADSAVIFLHGLGDTGHGWLSAFHSISKELPSTKFIFPHARSIPVSINYGMTMPAWYDIHGFDEKDKMDAVGMNQSKSDGKQEKSHVSSPRID